VYPGLSLGARRITPAGSDGMVRKWGHVENDILVTIDGFDGCAMVIR